MVFEKLLNRFLFVGCEPTYEECDFDGQLLWLPLHRDDEGGGLDRDCEYSFPCLMLPCPDATHLVLFFHRNAEDLGCCKQFCLNLRDKLNVHVFAIEYPGYGLFHQGAARDAPEPGASQAIRHAEVALAFLQREMALPLSRILLFGCSVGTGLAMKLAAVHEDLGGLVLVAPFLSVRAVAIDRVGSTLAWALLPKEDAFPNEVLAASVRCPTVIVHGPEDTVIPISHGERLYECLTCRKLLVTPEGLGHNSCLLAHRGLLVAPMARFFDLPDHTIEGPLWSPKKPPALAASPDLWPPAWASNPTPIAPATNGSCLDDWPPSPMTPGTDDDSWSELSTEPWARPNQAILPEQLQQSWPSRSSEVADASRVAREPPQRPMPRNPLQVLLATGKPTEPAGDPDDAPLRLIESLGRSPRGPRCCEQPGRVLLDVGSVDRFVEYTVEL